MSLLISLLAICIATTAVSCHPAKGRQLTRPFADVLAEVLSDSAVDIGGRANGSSVQHRESADSDSRCGISVFSENMRSGAGTTNRLALEGEFPWQVGISLNADPEEHDCIGTIISEYYVLTAAHCIQDVSDVSEVSVTAEHVRFKITRRVGNIVTHENFESPGNNYDIGLIKVTQPFDLSRGIVNSVCLPPPDLSPDQYVKGDFFVAGFNENSDDPDENQLIASNVPFIDQRTCRSMYRMESLNRVICAGPTSADGNVCNVQSGSPLVGRDASGRAMVLGIASWGFGCLRSGFPVVYTDVRQYMDWIVARAI